MRGVRGGQLEYSDDQGGEPVKLIYRGKIGTDCEVGEGWSDVCLDGRPLALRILEDIGGYKGYGDRVKIQVSVRYFTSPEIKSSDQLTTDLLLYLDGAMEAEYYDHYSELTGYLWTTESLVVGGHDLLKELYGKVGQYLHLEIDVHKTEPVT